ncbi:atrial natriuretic peptide receptor 1-like [Paramacrobiotus metropolitanus]|uniref:atrial natriuretic peptide receptor 1-like n=1 Tax=Paramacrobiotus metropolitanus TaxID=2943436 RepID=UPI0024463705|nr:atrial natriuretic peptide receptor 1-like [Paramacrobiotus metropolitanus]
MGNGEYVFVTTQPVQQAAFFGKAAHFNEPDEATFNITRSMLFMTVHTERNRYAALNAYLAKFASEKYNFTAGTDELPLDNYAAHSTINAIEMFTQLVHEATSTNGSRNTGLCPEQVLARRTASHAFQTSIDQVFINARKVHMLDFDIYAFDAGTRKMTKHSLFNASTRTISNLGAFNISWVLSAPPADVPLCGFTGTDGPCAFTGMRSTVISVSVVVLGCTAFGALIVTRLLRRRLTVRGADWWLLAREDLQGWSKSHFDSQMSVVLRSATWKGSPVWVKALPLPNTFTVDIGRLRRLIKELQHENINQFYGLIFADGDILLLSHFCSKNSLIDLLENIFLDTTFQLSFIADLLRGLHYLHSLPFPHGRLRSACCLIDSHFTLKIGNAPENARTSTLTGDVYAAGVVVFHILTGAPCSIVNRKNYPDSLSPDLQFFVRRCGQADPQKRPTAKRMLLAFYQFAQTKAAGITPNSNVCDRVIARLAMYAAALEAAVLERTKELQAEQMKCDSILALMLPQYVIQRLRNHNAVQAEYFEHVSVCFASLQGFASWANQALPGEIIGLIARVQTTFDLLVSSFQGVQKVEAVNDCYLVVSGIPRDVNLSEEAHAVEMCRLAVAMLNVTAYNNAIGSAVLSGCSVRCGIHSGSCAGGVIGTKVPRYCIFGDTVNVASRMESAGQGGHIHISGTTAQLLRKSTEFVCALRGDIPIKGKGMMTTFWLKPTTSTTIAPADVTRQRNSARRGRIPPSYL